MPTDNNSIPDLVELVLRHRGPSDFEKNVGVHVELRIAVADLDGPDKISFKVGLKRAWLNLELSGLEVVPGSRFGEPTRSNEVDTKYNLSKEQTNMTALNAKAGAGAMATPNGPTARLELSGGAEHNSNAITKASTTATDLAAHMRVKARGNLMWEVTELQYSKLDATYLNNDVLCIATPTRGANAKTIAISAFTKQRDVILEANKDGKILLFRTPNQDRLMKILISKAISGSGTNYNGTITFSSSEIALEE